MFCEKCGSKLMEDAKFCTNCGNNTQGLNDRVSDHANVDKEIKLRVKPTFNLLYMGYIRIIITYTFIAAMLILGFILVPIMGVSALALIAVFTGMFAVIMALPFISLVFRSFQYKAIEYNFYDTKVSYRDGFLNKNDKEIKYKYIREIFLQQSLFQRRFKLGTIFLDTDTGSFTGGISIMDVENPEEIYKKIKEIMKI